MDCGIFQSLACWVGWLASMVQYSLIKGAEFLLYALAAVANAILWLLPSVSFGSANFSTGVLATLNYFLPVVELTTAFTAVMTAWVVYRIYDWGLKWAKASDTA